jgi:sugar transferase (PEP-CTERM/EpsH1 system associated)
MANHQVSTAPRPHGHNTPVAPPRPLRIVHVIHWLGAGGLEKGVSTLVRHASPGIEHVVVAMSGVRDPDRVLPPGTRLLNLKKPEGHSLRFLGRLAGVLRELSPCVVHTRNWAGMDGVAAARLAGIRAVVHGEHGWGMDDPLGTNPRRIAVRRFLSRWTRHFLCVSKDLERWLTERVRVRCPVVQIYNGVDTDAFAGASTSAELKAELGLRADAILVGFVGRLDLIKDHPTLFRAFARVRERFPLAELLCVGDGPDREAIERAVVPGVHLLGTRYDVPRILRGLDLFVLTSKNEGISNTILEAMASGLPVVATRVGGNPELVEDGATGRLFPSGDAEALERLLAEYLEDPRLRAAHGRAGRERVVRLFGTTAMVRSYEEVWRACAEHLAP